MSSELLEETVSRLLAEHLDPQARRAAEALGWAAECWGVLEEAGLARVGVPEEAGGSGGSLSDAFTVLRLAGRYAVPLPIAECGLLGGWLLASAGLSAPVGPLSVAVPRKGDRLVLERSGQAWVADGCLRRVPWGAQAAGIAAFASSAEGVLVVLLDPQEATVVRGSNVAGEPRDELGWKQVILDNDRVGVAAQSAATEIELRGALSRALLMAGAMQAVAELTVTYASERYQFGRPISSFQAVAGRLVRLVSEAEAASLAAEVAALRFAEEGVKAFFEVAAAKATASRAASEVAAQAHQVHGAIGMTQEYPLHYFTRRLWTWRQEWGSEGRWSRHLGESVFAAGVNSLWPRVTASPNTTTKL